MARINIFENISALGLVQNTNGWGAGSLQMHYVYMPGSLSFNQVAMLFSASGTTAKTATLSFGLYSLTGSTLSLANSASTSTAPTANTGLWITFSTSAAQDITPGDWFFAFMSSTSSNGNLSVVANIHPTIQRSHGGPFFRGYYTVTTTAFPASIATSDMAKEGNGAGDFTGTPYVLISA